MSGSIVLVGGEEFTERAVALDRHLLGLVGTGRPRVAIVPTAAVPENADLAAQHGVRHFERLGAAAEAVMLRDRDGAADPKLIGRLEVADIIYFTGGSPPYLLETLRDTPAWDAVTRRLGEGVVLAGSSAGAMVLCEKMLFRGTLTDALGLVSNAAVLPHFERWGETDGLRGSVPETLTLLGIDGGAGTVGGDTGWTVAGDGRVTVLRGSERRELTAGDSFRIG